MNSLSRLHAWRRTFHGFTLVELLVVVAIVAILATILMAALKKAAETGRNTRCRSNLHQLHSMAMAGAKDFSFSFPSVGDLAKSSMTNQSVFVCPFDKRSKTLISYIGGGTGSGINTAGGNVANVVYRDDTNAYSHATKKKLGNAVYVDGHVGTIP